MAWRHSSQADAWQGAGDHVHVSGMRIFDAINLIACIEYQRFERQIFARATDLKHQQIIQDMQSIISSVAIL